MAWGLSEAVLRCLASGKWREVPPEDCPTPEGKTLDARNAFASQNFQQSSNKQGKTRQYRTRCLSRKSLVPQGFAGMKRNEWVPGKTDVIFLVRMRSAVQIRPAAPRKALSLNGFKAFLLQKRMKKAGFWKRIRPSSCAREDYSRLSMAYCASSAVNCSPYSEISWSYTPLLDMFMS